MDVIGEVDHDALGIHAEGCGDEFGVQGARGRQGGCIAESEAQHRRDPEGG